MTSLPDAIRLGGVVSDHQIFGQGADDSGGTCAMLGALAAVGWPDTDSGLVWPEANWIVKALPCGCYVDPSWAGWSIRKMVVHLNDVHRWGRFEIASAVSQVLEAEASRRGASLAPEQPVASGPFSDRQELMAQMSG